MSNTITNLNEMKTELRDMIVELESHGLKYKHSLDYMQGVNDGRTTKKWFWKVKSLMKDIDTVRRWRSAGVESLEPHEERRINFYFAW